VVNSWHCKTDPKETVLAEFRRAKTPRPVAKSGRVAGARIFDGSSGMRVNWETLSLMRCLIFV